MNQEDNESAGVPARSDIGDQNVERLLGQSYRPEPVRAEFAKRVEAAMCSAARDAAEARATTLPRTRLTRRRRLGWTRLAWSAIAASLFIAVGFTVGRQVGRHANNGLVSESSAYVVTPESPARPDQRTYEERELASSVESKDAVAEVGMAVDDLASAPAQAIALLPMATVPPGEVIATSAGQRLRVGLADGSALYLNQNTQVNVDAVRQITVKSGEIYLDVAPRESADAPDLVNSDTDGADATAARLATFRVFAPGRAIVALGTKFGVRTHDSGSDVFVTQGKVQVNDLAQPISAGQQVVSAEPGNKVFDQSRVRQSQSSQDSATPVSLLPRASAVLDWTRDLIASGEPPLVPASSHAGGSIVARDPNGNEARLSLRKYHVDVHIEDGFARTTIDQTYFNHTSWRLEGTFHFPLPPDASLSRLAMYVEGRLMEGGMAERNHARDVFEKIVRTQKDPALLEWVDGSTFKMRVFPLEARQEKRIILSYTQRLEPLYGSWKYRFPAGHSLESVRDWSFHGRVKRGVGLTWSCDSHQLKQSQDGNDLLLDAAANEVKLDRDILVRFADRGFEPHAQRADAARFSTTVHEGQRYFMLRYRPALPAKAERQRRDWIFLFESSGDRDAVLARVQADVIKTILRNAEHDDTFAILTAGTQVRSFADTLLPATVENVKKANDFLDAVHLVGALDLGQALSATERLVQSGKNCYVVHLGSGLPVLGERAQDKLIQRLPANARYVGVGVGKRWARQFMKTAASRTGGYFTQINPDEPVAWRAFDLYSTLNTPRLLGISVNDQAERATFLCHEDSIAHGEELCAITRLGAGEALPAKLIVTGSLDGEPFRREIAVEQVANQAEYLPRTWAKLRIDQLLAEDPARHQAEIVALSKAMYVMSPFTSLLVLETEQMYVQFGVDRGRKDHWAMYACPPQIPVVFEPETRNQPDTQAAQLAARQAGPAKSDNGVVLPIHPRFLMPSGETHQPSPFGNYFHFWVQPSNQETNTGYFMSRGFTTLGVSPSQQNEFLLYDAADWMRDGALDMDGYFSRVSDFEDRFGQVDALFGYARPQTAGSDFLDRYELAFLPDGQRRLGGYGTAFRWGAQAPRNWARDFSVLEAREFAGGAWRRLEVLQESERLELLEQRTRRRNLGRLLQGRGAQNLWYDSNGNWEETEFAPVAFGSVDSKTLEELGVVILRGSPQDVRAMREVVSQLERVSGTGDGRGWPYMNTWLGRPWRESDGDRPAARADDEMYGKALGGIAREKFLVDHLYDLVAKKERAEPLAKRKLRLAEMLLTGKSAAGLGGDHVPDRLFDFHSQALLYKPPTFSGDMRVFNDLLAYAPGMSTTLRDVHSILDQAKRDSDEIQQEIDPRARALFEKSRSGGWQAITLVSGSDEQPSRFLCDGQGRFSFERTTPEGLHEKVLCDGTVLWHVYPELGVGAKRTVGRFDRARLASMVPWLLPPLEDFTRGANVEVMDDVTLAFVPRDVAKVGREGVADDQDESRKYPRLELKFATDGRLTDRRWLEMPGRTLLIREHYAADGTVHLFDAGDREIAARKLTIEPASAPNLVPIMSDLVVLTMPLRSREQVFQSAGRPQDGQFGQWSEEDALALLAADILQNPSEAMQIVGQRFFAKGDRRLGLYTLLLSSGVTWNPATDIALNNQSHVRFDPAADHPDSVLARYIYLHAQQMATAGTIGEMDLARSDSGLVQRLAGFRDLYVLWTSGKAASEPDRTKLRGRALQFVRESNGSFFGWVVLSLLQNSTQDANGFRELSDAYRVFERSRGLSYAARYEAAYSAYQTGDAQRAMDLFRELHERTLKEGFVPPVDTRFRQSFQNTPHGQTALAKLWRDSAEMLIARGGHVAALALAWQCNQLGDAVAAQEVFATVMRGASGEYRWQISLAAVDYLIQVGEYARADALLQPMLDDETLGKFASLWRLGAMVAEKQGMTASAIARLDRAMDIEYSQLPNEVDLESARTEFRKLLDGYQKLADSLVSLPSQPPQDILHRIARAADRWRSLDPDDTAACQAAARVFDRLGARERAWEYLTTPFGEKPNELPAWLGLGQWLRAQGCIELADRAYQLAFAAEPGNAQIIWELAQMLEQSGKPAAAQQWYRAIAEGQWGSQFESIQSQARQAIR